MLQDQIKKITEFTKKIINMLLEPVIGYTRVVFATKYILSFIAIALILTLILLPYLNPVHKNFRITFSAIEDGTADEDPKMINPRFQGVDRDDQTYSISANSATKKRNETLVLDDINASLNLRDGSWVTLLAKTGVFQHKKDYLKLSNSVNLFTNEGYEFYTKSIEIDIDKNTAYGYHKVHGHGPVGSITADRFTVFNKGERTLFEGNVKVVLYPKKRKYFREQDK